MFWLYVIADRLVILYNNNTQMKALIHIFTRLTPHIKNLYNEAVEREVFRNIFL